MPIRSRYAWGDSTFVEVRAPYLIQERGRAGKYNRVLTRGVYELADAGSGTTRVSFTLETKPKFPSDRLAEFGGLGRMWMKRKSPQGPRPPARRSSRRAAIAARAPPSRAARASPPRLPVPARRQPLESAAAMKLRRLAVTATVAVAAASSLAACGSDRAVHRQDRGHVRQHGRPEVPGPDLASAQRRRLRGPRLPDRPARRARRAWPSARSGSRSSSASSTGPTSRTSPRRSS